jgi:formylglycine-generating enzyme
MTIDPKPGMIWVPGGSFRIGSDRHYPEEAPAHRVTVGGFWIDKYAVTNRDFAAFVAATGHKTIAERTPNPADYPGADPRLLKPGSLVFHKSKGSVDLRDISNWWRWTPGAYWRHPEGRGSSVASRLEHPVVHVAFADAEAYARWAGKALPSEAEWEAAARGGLDGAEFVWGDEFAPDGRQMANTWQGEFPWQNLCADGFEGTAPVGRFPPNGYGLYDMAGNVWEWTTDWFAARHEPGPRPCCMPAIPRATPSAEIPIGSVDSAQQLRGGLGDASPTLRDPLRPEGGEGRVSGAARAGSVEASYDPAQPLVQIPRKVVKGGSFLCAPNYCRRYRPAARHAQMVDSAMSHIGFRCVIREP